MKELWLGSATKYKMTVTFLSAYLKGHNQMCRHLITIMSSVKIQTLSMEFSFPLKSLSWLNLKPQSFQSGIFFLSLKHKKLEKTERRWGKQKTITPHSVFWIHKRKKSHDYSMKVCTSKLELHDLFIKESRCSEWSQMVSISRETPRPQNRSITKANSFCRTAIRLFILHSGRCCSFNKHANYYSAYSSSS